MQSSYIVDAFLTATAWMVLTYLYFGCRSLIKTLNTLMTAPELAVAITHLFKRGVLLAVPFGVLFVFFLWRFYGLMIATQTWGAGGMGLLIAMLCIGLILIALYAMLVCVRHSSFVHMPAQNNTDSDGYNPSQSQGGFE
jgi:hypothetical protein